MRIKKGNWSYNITDSRKEKLEKLIEQFDKLDIKRETLSGYLDVAIRKLIDKQQKDVELVDETKRYK